MPRPLVLQLACVATAATYRRPPLDAELIEVCGDFAEDRTLQARAGAVVAVVTSSPRGITSTELAMLPRVRCIGNFGVGLERLPLDAARERNIVVTYTPDLLTDDVADLAILLTLASLRKLPAADRFVRAGRWGQTPFPLGRAARSLHFGIFGLGRIGLAAAHRAAAIGFEIGYCSRRPRADVGYAAFESIGALADWADILLLTADSNAQTHKIVNSQVLVRLGPSGLLVNVARGALIDEDALLSALRTGDLGAAALDVFATEPHPRQELLELDNLIVSPHIGSATAETRAAMTDRVFEDVGRVLRGEAPVSPVVYRTD